jgi:two-component system, cell cycle response regulator DivK
MRIAMTTVLIVDDEPSLRTAVELTLRTHGFDVTAVEDGEACLEAVSAFPPDVILLDIMLPLIDGWEVKRRLNEDPATARIPVVAMTALASREYRDKAAALDFAGYVVKPMRFEEIRDVIASALVNGGHPAPRPGV